MFKQLPKFIFFTGKGGVGKTSLACATALNLAEQGQRILLVSTDPASNVGQVFETKIGSSITAIPSVTGLDAIEINPQEAAAAYRERIVGPMRDSLPAKALKSIEEQLSGACTTEIAAFDEFTGLLTNSELTDRYAHVVFDTAPTGHTLLLLDATGSYHRDILRHMAPSTQRRMVTPMMRLQNPDLTKIFMVTLAETTPVLEAAHLQDDLRRAGIEPWGWLINSSLAATATTHPLLQQRANSEVDLIEKVREDLAQRFTVMPMQAQDPVGIEKLHALCTHLDADKAA